MYIVGSYTLKVAAFFSGKRKENELLSEEIHVHC